MRPSSPRTARVPSRCVASPRASSTADAWVQTRAREIGTSSMLSLMDHTETRLCPVYDSIETGLRRRTMNSTWYTHPHTTRHTPTSQHTKHTHRIASRTHEGMHRMHPSRHSFVRSFVRRRDGSARDVRPLERARHVARDSRLADDRVGGEDGGTTGREMRESRARDASSRTRASTRAMRDVGGDAGE